MNCQDVTSILDNHTGRSLSSTRRALVDEHLSGCGICANAWMAQETLLGQIVPDATPESLRNILASLVPDGDNRERPRLRWTTAAIGGALTAGTLLAAVTLIQHLDDTTDEPAKSANIALEAASDSPVELVAAMEQALQSKVDDELYSAVMPDGLEFALLKISPVYPSEALTQRLEGQVVIEFTITSQGAVTDVVALSSSDAVFEAAAIEAGSSFKYKPRVVDGRPIDVPGVRNRITFAIDDSEPSPEQVQAIALAPSGSEFRAMIAPAISCINSDNFSCALLVLDEITATHELIANEAHLLWRLYGYVHARSGNFEQAIAAYEVAVDIPGVPEHGARLTLAHLYYERQQYQSALDAAVEHLTTVQSPPTRAVYAFVDRLRQLGATVTR